MSNIIIVGHGQFAKGIKSAIDLIIGANSIITIDFTPEMSREQLEMMIVGYLEPEDNVILTDILGGTPFNVSAKLSSNTTKVIYGTNIAIVLEIMNCSFDSIEIVIENCTTSIGIFRLETNYEYEWN